MKDNNAMPFRPTFGNKPERIVGRNQELDDFLSALQSPIGAPGRCTLFLGQRGMGKTALLIEIAERASRLGYVTARVTAYDEMPDEIIETLQRNAERDLKNSKRQLTGFSAGDLGFSLGLEFSNQDTSRPGFRSRLTAICDALDSLDMGVLILVDEAQTSEAMRQVAITYQHLVGEGKNIALCMAGLPHSVSSVLNDSVLMFLNRAHKVQLAPISTTEVRAYYAQVFSNLGIGISASLLSDAAEATRGFPYLMQLIGYFLLQYAQTKGKVTREMLSQAVDDAHSELQRNVFQPILAPLSDNDRRMLEAMAVDEGVSLTADIKERLGVDDSFLQPYRRRLIDAGVVESPRRGELVFAVPYLADYLRETADGAQPSS